MNGPTHQDDSPVGGTTTHPDNGSADSPESTHSTVNDGAHSDMDESAILNALANAKDQSELERDISRQADHLLAEQADERDNRRLEKAEAQKKRLASQLKKVEQKLAAPGGSATKALLQGERKKLETDLKTTETELQQIRSRISERHQELVIAENERQADNTGGQRPGESRRDFLIRTGKITPFAKIPQLPRLTSSLGDAMLDAEQRDEDQEEAVEDIVDDAAGPRSHQVLKRPGFADIDSPESSVAGEDAEEDDWIPDQPAKRRRLKSRAQMRKESVEPDSGAVSDEDAYVPDMNDRQLASLGTTESDSELEADRILASEPQRKRKRTKLSQQMSKTSGRQNGNDTVINEDLAGFDDGNEELYQNRLLTWSKQRSAKRRQEQQKRDETVDVDASDREWLMPHPTRVATDIDGLKVPGDIYPSLYDYQRTGVRWLRALYEQHVGGILGDEMGLGKTVQIISFLASLHHSNMLDKPCLIVCPATVMKQWVKEFHTWWPPFRVSILHSSGSGMFDVRREEAMEDELVPDDYEAGVRHSKNFKIAKNIVNRVIRHGHILVTTYAGLQSYSDLLIDVQWEYAVLDEGHKIRNPNTSITLHCKELRTPNRVILSGTPIQNNLTELWSLFDFVYPMRLGTLVSFRMQFDTPIRIGGYANASNLQVETAARCAEALKDAISPYLLQRYKADVAMDLPPMKESVLFCRLTAFQRQQYQIFLDSDDMKSILAGKRHNLFGIDILRKICNHPDLVDHKRLPNKAGYDYGKPSKSGKMMLVKALLELWKKQGHKTLLFAQHRIMLDILEKFVRKMDGVNYVRMDGNTSIKDRQDLVDEFNKDPNIHLFLLTTKVGGLGVNLTGADRIIIYDPDWNPSTDVQARERAYRLGQTRPVEVYRLLTAGTIEEKIYHRQVFKQVLTNKVLKDSKQRQTFHLRELHDLFTLTDGDATETGQLFKGTELQLSREKSKDKQISLPTPLEVTDLSSIAALARHEDYVMPGVEPENDQSGHNGDERILSAIFSKSGVHSAHEHSKIIAGSTAKPKVTADPEMVTREAKRVAAAAAAELQRAARIAPTIPAGQTTWTGAFGVSGRPGAPAGRGAGRGTIGGSSSLLGGLRNRQNQDESAGVASSSRTTLPAPSSTSTARRGRGVAPVQPRGRDFLIMIRDFMKANNGTVFTQMLVDHFNRYCGTEQRVAEFHEMVRKIAWLEKGRSGGRGKWHLKDEYKN